MHQLQGKSLTMSRTEYCAYDRCAERLKLPPLQRYLAKLATRNLQHAAVTHTKPGSRNITETLHADQRRRGCPLTLTADQDIQYSIRSPCEWKASIRELVGRGLIRHLELRRVHFEVSASGRCDSHTTP